MQDIGWKRMVLYFRGGEVPRDDAEVGELVPDPIGLFACRLALGQGLLARILGHNQSSRTAHGGAVIRIDRAAEEARLVSGAVDAGVGPREFVPAAHFDKPLQKGICHGCFEFLRCN